MLEKKNNKSKKMNDIWNLLRLVLIEYIGKITEQEYEKEEGIKIVRSKKFAMKPMDAEEACMEMDLLGHDFFVFRNCDTNEVNVVYKRKSGAYGLIEPEF